MIYAYSYTGTGKVKFVTEEEIRYYPKKWRELFYEMFDEMAQSGSRNIRVSIREYHIRLYDIDPPLKNDLESLQRFRRINQSNACPDPIVTFRSFGLDHLDELVDDYIQKNNLTRVPAWDKSIRSKVLYKRGGKQEN